MNGLYFEVNKSMVKVTMRPVVIIHLFKNAPFWQRHTGQVLPSKRSSHLLFTGTDACRALAFCNNVLYKFTLSLPLSHFNYYFFVLSVVLIFSV